MARALTPGKQQAVAGGAASAATKRGKGAAAPASAPADADEPKLHTPSAAASRHPRDPVYLAVPLVAMALTLALQWRFPLLDYVGLYFMLAIQGALFVATLLFGAGRAWDDWALLAALGSLAAFTRFWRIEDPQGIIFDEVRGRPRAARRAPAPRAPLLIHTRSRSLARTHTTTTTTTPLPGAL